MKDKYALIIDAIQLEEFHKQRPFVFKHCCMVNYDAFLKAFRITTNDHVSFADVGDYIVDNKEKIFVMKKKEFEKKYVKYEH